MSLKTSYAGWVKYRQTVRELNGLTDRELNDIGIQRGDITFIARKVR